ncbi:MAG: MarR family transcriptional regulator [Dehalococcoidia bacterium]|jgi:DNA-binding MarR family transcriptional regulator
MEYESMVQQDESIMADGRLVYAVSAIMRKASDRALAPWGVSVSQAPVLVVLREAGSPLTISEIARQLYLETPSITTMVDRLAERGYVERLKDRKDRRKTPVRLTKAGKQLVDSIREPGKQLQEEMFGVLGRKERETLRSILQKFRDANASRI